MMVLSEKKNVLITYVYMEIGLDHTQHRIIADDSTMAIYIVQCMVMVRWR